jgi:hypothetical protein
MKPRLVGLGAGGLSGGAAVAAAASIVLFSFSSWLPTSEGAAGGSAVAGAGAGDAAMLQSGRG